MDTTRETIRLHSYGLHWPLPPALMAGGTAFGIGEEPPRADRFENSVNSAVAAEQSGMDGVLFADATDWYCPGSVWNEELCDMLASAPDPHGVFTSEPIIAAAGAVTERVEFMWGPVDCVRRAPINIAQMVLTLDHATRGRASVILAQGQADHMRQTGISRIGTKDKLWDGVQIVRRLIRDTEPFSFRGRVWKFDRGALATPYYGDEPPDVLVAGSHDETLELIGRYADGWCDAIPGNYCGNDPTIYADKVGTMRRAAETCGRDPDSLRIYAFLCCFMMDDEDLLDDALDHPLSKWNSLMNGPAPEFRRHGLPHPIGGDFNYMKDVIPEWYSKEEFYDVTSRTPRDAAKIFNFYGTADQVLAMLDPWFEQGITDVLFYNTAGMAGSKYMASCHEADQKLQQALKDRPIVHQSN
jgi:phthiodiolone/phenolphthiodiolone dimycocerosates ketoreductase